MEKTMGDRKSPMKVAFFFFGKNASIRAYSDNLQHFWNYISTYPFSPNKNTDDGF